MVSPGRDGQKWRMRYKKGGHARCPPFCGAWDEETFYDGGCANAYPPYVNTMPWL